MADYLTITGGGAGSVTVPFVQDAGITVQVLDGGTMLVGQSDEPPPTQLTLFVPLVAYTATLPAPSTTEDSIMTVPVSSYALSHPDPSLTQAGDIEVPLTSYGLAVPLVSTSIPTQVYTVALPAPATLIVSATIVGLTDGQALEGTHETITSAATDGTVEERRWGTTSGGSDLGTGTSPTDFVDSFPGTLYAGVRVSGVWYEASAPISTNDFVLTVETADTFTLPFRAVGTYNGTVHWGDGTSSTITSHDPTVDTDLVHTYPGAGTYTIRCRGQFGLPLFGGAADRNKLRTVENFGTVWTGTDPISAFSDCDGLTSFKFGRCNTGSMQTWFGFLNNSSTLTTIDCTGADFSSAINFEQFASGNAALTSCNIHVASGLDVMPLRRADEMFMNCPNIVGLDPSGFNIRNILNNVGSLGTRGFFNFIQSPASIASATLDATYINWAAQLPIITPFNLDATPIPEGVICDFQSSTGTAASVSARRALASAGFWIEDGALQPPEAMIAPQVTVDSGTQVTVTRAARPYADGPVSSYDLRYRETPAGTWVEIIGIGATRVVDGLTASTEYEFQTRAVSPNPWGVGVWSPSRTVTTASAGGFALETVSEEPVITVTSGNISVTIGSGPYAGTYDTNISTGLPLTVAMVEAAPTPIKLPVVTGTPVPGQTLTITPGLWIYDGPDPGDQTWQQQLDGVNISGGTGLTYVVQAGDVGSDFTVEETFGGSMIESVPRTIVLAGIVGVPVTSYNLTLPAADVIAPNTGELLDQDSNTLLDQGNNVLLDHTA